MITDIHCHFVPKKFFDFASARPEFAMLPIVLLTVKAELANIRKGLALGADGYITKPYSKNQLAEVIGRVLKHPAGR